MSKVYLGPMSKNIVDTVIEYSNSYKLPFTFIPSRRQIEYTGGYVNDWTTKDFVNYVKTKGKYISIERDHGGPGQGIDIDDGIDSFKEDCKFMDIIHIDPWKKYQKYEDGLEETIKGLNFCYSENPDLFFEISTEQGIRIFEVDELEKFILDLQERLKPEVYKRIKYFVVQCGTGLLEAENIGKYEKERLVNMVQLCKKYGFLSKEHNGDWITVELMREKFSLGLDCINVAPELGQIETKTILSKIKTIELEDKRKELFEKFYNICYNSKKWVKWVSKDFKPEENKEKLINICGHYVFSLSEFKEIKKELKGIDVQIKKDIIHKLREYHSLHESFYKVLITTSGIGSRLGDLTKYTNKSLIKVGDKLAISHILEKYNPLSEFVITLGYKGELVKDFLELSYPNYTFNFVWIDNFNKKGSSLCYSLSKVIDKLNCPFFFNCCDSLTKDSLSVPQENTIFVKSHNDSSQYASINSNSSEYIDLIRPKGEKHYTHVYTGISFIKSYENYWEKLKKLLEQDNHTESSDIHVINLLLKDDNFKYKELETWYDSGNVGEINNKIKTDYPANYTVLEKNNESICFINNFVIKFFSDQKIVENRIKRGKHLYPLTPEIIDSRKNYIKMELIEGVIMSDIKKHGEIKQLLNWSYKNLWVKNNFQTQNFDKICQKFYFSKTILRIDKTLQGIKEYNNINSIDVGNIKDILQKINFDIYNTQDYTNYHGDFILDNIIKTSEGYKLIDWRENFGGELYNGDKYYDLAKLRHNIIFNHSNINRGMFNFDAKNGNVTIELKCNFTLINQLQDFEDFIRENDLNLKKIKILTALIWLNMSPLYESPLKEFLFYFGKYNLYLEIF